MILYIEKKICILYNKIKKNIFFIIVSMFIFSCSTEPLNEEEIEPKNSILKREVLTHHDDAGGGGSSSDYGSGCSPFESLHFNGTSTEGNLNGRIVPFITSQTGMFIPLQYYVDCNISYSKNSMGNYVVVKNFTTPLSNCSFIGDRQVVSNSNNSFIIGNTLYVQINFRVKYTVPKWTLFISGDGYININVDYNRVKIYTLQ